MGLDPIAGYITRWGLKWDLAQYKEEMAKFDREQVFQVDDLQALSDRLWRGELSYLDYSKNTRGPISLPICALHAQSKIKRVVVELRLR